MLGVARVMGETAPLLLLTGFTTSHQHQPVQRARRRRSRLSSSTRPAAQSDVAVDRAWGAALILIVIVMLLNLIARLVARFSRVR